MGITRRCQELEDTDVDKDVVDGVDGDLHDRCTLCDAVKLTAVLNRCWQCGDGPRYCAEECSSACSCSAKQAVCLECAVDKDKCPDCERPVCVDCKVLARDCSGCGKKFCRAGDCGARCISCGEDVCSKCSVADYKERDVRRKCFDCDVRRSSDLFGDLGRLGAPTPQKAKAKAAPRRVSRVLRRHETSPWTPPRDLPCRSDSPVARSRSPPRTPSKRVRTVETSASDDRVTPPRVNKQAVDGKPNVFAKKV